MAKKYKWHKLPLDPATIQWTRGHVASSEVVVAGKTLCLGRLNDEWFAFAASCPHAGAPMTEAYITGPAASSASASSASAPIPGPASSAVTPPPPSTNVTPPITKGDPLPNCFISCPIHGLRFNLRNGRDTNGEGYTLKTYPVELRDDGLYLGIEEGGLFKWF